MNAPSRPSLWKRLVGGSRIPSGPDFGDMGTAFGLDATVSIMSDWSKVGSDGTDLDAAISKASVASTNQPDPANAMDDFERKKELGGMAWPAWLGGRSMRRT
ncbi:hypothetical protein BH09PSE5_BH09PSE5_24350 [soil metagenome]